MDPTPEPEEGSLVLSPYVDAKQTAHSSLTDSVTGFINISMDAHPTGSTALVVEIAIPIAIELCAHCSLVLHGSSRATGRYILRVHHYREHRGRIGWL